MEWRPLLKTLEFSILSVWRDDFETGSWSELSQAKVDESTNKITQWKSRTWPFCKYWNKARAVASIHSRMNASSPDEAIAQILHTSSTLMSEDARSQESAIANVQNFVRAQQTVFLQTNLSDLLLEVTVMNHSPNPTTISLCSMITTMSYHINYQNSGWPGNQKSESHVPEFCSMVLWKFCRMVLWKFCTIYQKRPCFAYPRSSRSLLRQFSRLSFSRTSLHSLLNKVDCLSSLHTTGSLAGPVSMQWSLQMENLHDSEVVLEQLTTLIIHHDAWNLSRAIQTRTGLRIFQKKQCKTPKRTEFQRTSCWMIWKKVFIDWIK